MDESRKRYLRLMSRMIHDIEQRRELLLDALLERSRDQPPSHHGFAQMLDWLNANQPAAEAPWQEQFCWEATHCMVSELMQAVEERYGQTAQEEGPT